MKYRLVAIGKLKGIYCEACAYFQKRLANYAKLEIIEIKQSQGEKESAALLKASQGYVIALDARGKEFTSEQLAKEVTNFANDGISQISLLLGGADGHSQVLRKQVNALWSLSKLTFAHELARLILLEQLYRTETIRANHPYHHK